MAAELKEGSESMSSRPQQGAPMKPRTIFNIREMDEQ
jgi:hypothetical protein